MKKSAKRAAQAHSLAKRPEKTDTSGRFGKRVVIVCVTVICIYTAAAAALFFLNGSEPSTLTASVYAFFGSELGFCALKRVLCGKKEAQFPTAPQNSHESSNHTSTTRQDSSESHD